MLESEQHIGRGRIVHRVKDKLKHGIEKHIIPRLDREGIHNAVDFLLKIYDFEIVNAEVLDKIGDHPVIFAFFPHAGHTDSPFVRHAIPNHYRLKLKYPAPEYWYKKLATNFFGAVFVSRIPFTRGKDGASPSSRKESLRRLVAELVANWWFVMAPEGTRDYADRPYEEKPFEDGIAELVQKHPSTVVIPVFLKGHEKVMPKGSILPRLLNNGKRFHIRVEFGSPMEFDMETLEGDGVKGRRKTITQMIRQRLLQMAGIGSKVEVE